MSAVACRVSKTSTWNLDAIVVKKNLLFYADWEIESVKI